MTRGEAPDPSLRLASGAGAEASRCPPERRPAAAAPLRPACRRSPDWRPILAASSPREVLGRLMNSDPLGLSSVVEERLRARAFLLDADRVFLRSAARCARLALRYRGDPPLDRWLVERVDEALLELVELEASAESQANPGAHELAVFESLARPLGLDPQRMRRACAVHNRLPEEQRRAFREVVLEGRDLDELAREGRRGATQIARAARSALLAVLSEVGEEDLR